MNARQFDALRALVKHYAYNLPDDLAERRMDQIKKARRNVCFAWAGGIKPGDPHYHRVQVSVPHNYSRAQSDNLRWILLIKPRLP